MLYCEHDHYKNGASMRISKDTKIKNRKTILKAAEKLFTDKGFEKTTTRDIASTVGMAAGTMFNYFDSKESLAMTLVIDALVKGRKAYARRLIGSEDFHEEFFLLISSELRALRPFRSYIGPVLESALSLFSKSAISAAGDEARLGHLKIIENIITKHGYSSVPTLLSSSLYWSLYLGILAFWSTDNSRNQEETLALMDYSLLLFARSIEGID
jgi:AcrR family transcriptional regulator